MNNHAEIRGGQAINYNVDTVHVIKWACFWVGNVNCESQPFEDRSSLVWRARGTCVCTLPQ